MSGSGVQLAWGSESKEQKSRTPLAHLLHALNQPLTGLQCSMELAISGPRPVDHYVRTLRDGLELVSRMRLLVEALRELADTQAEHAGASVLFRFDSLVREVADELEPVAAEKGVRFAILNSTVLPVHSNRPRLASLLFRTLDSIVSLSAPHSEMQIAAVQEEDKACVILSSIKAPPPEHAPFSRPELGLLTAQAGWERLGASWVQTQTGGSESVMIRLPMALTSAQHS